MRWTLQKATEIDVGILVACKARPRTRTQLHAWFHGLVGNPDAVSQTTVNNRLNKLELAGRISRGPDPDDAEQQALFWHNKPYTLHFGITHKGRADVSEYMLYACRLMEVEKWADGYSPHNKRAREMVKKLGAAPRVDPRAEAAPFPETRYDRLA